MDDAKNYDEEFALLLAAQKAGRTDGDGPADVAPVEEVAGDGE